MMTCATVQPLGSADGRKSVNVLREGCAHVPDSAQALEPNALLLA